MNRKAQFGIVAFVGVVLVLLFLAPVLLKVVRAPVVEFSSAINTTSPLASQTVDSIEGTFSNLWDWVLMIGFVINVILLLIASFFIDTHPIFVIFYIMAGFFLLVFAPNVIDAVNAVWDAGSGTVFTEETGLYLTGTTFILNHFGEIILAIFVLSGIVMYAKFKYFAT